MAAGRTRVCSVGFSVALCLCTINHPQIDGEGYRACEEASRGIRVRGVENF